MPDPEKDAQQLLQTVWIGADDPGRTRLPVDPFYIAKTLGIGVYLDNTLASNVAGMLVKRAGYDDPEILLNPDDSRNRQRFTCAHELGHYNKRAQTGDDQEWRYVDERNFLSSQGTDPDERYANQFAAALLMPTDEVWDRAKSNGSDVAALAAEFGVSADAMNFRLINLDLK